MDSFNQNSQTVNNFRFTFDYLAMTSELAEKLMSTITLKAEEGEEEVSMNLGSSGDRTFKPSFNYIQEEEEDEEDLIDPATAIKEGCAESQCSSAKARLDDCNDRVTGKSKTTETCFEEILDFYHCVDHCAAPQIFQSVK